jgi:hypothetical protein
LPYPFRWIPNETGIQRVAGIGGLSESSICRRDGVHGLRISIDHAVGAVTSAYRAGRGERVAILGMRIGSLARPRDAALLGITP